MGLVGIAGSAGVTSSTIENLMAGEVTAGIGGRLNTPSSSLQEFVDGGTSVGLAVNIGTTSATLQELRNRISKEGAICFLLGLACSSKARDNSPPSPR
jgi:hypothetical protein